MVGLKVLHRLGQGPPLPHEQHPHIAREEFGVNARALEVPLAARAGSMTLTDVISTRDRAQVQQGTLDLAEALKSVWTDWKRGRQLRRRTAEGARSFEHIDGTGRNGGIQCGVQPRSLLIEHGVASDAFDKAVGWANRLQNVNGCKGETGLCQTLSGLWRKYLHDRRVLGRQAQIPEGLVKRMTDLDSLGGKHAVYNDAARYIHHAVRKMEPVRKPSD